MRQLLFFLGVFLLLLFAIDRGASWELNQAHLAMRGGQNG